MKKIAWSPKVRQAKIRQLYQNGALGVLDDTLEGVTPFFPEVTFPKLTGGW